MIKKEGIDMSKVTIFDHPLIQHKLSILRDENTGTKEFRELITEIAMLMCYEATRNLPLEDVKIKTPLTEMTAKKIAGRKLAAFRKGRSYRSLSRRGNPQACRVL